MKKTILIVAQPEITGKMGGAISMFTFLANHLQDDGYQVHGVCNSLTPGRPVTLKEDIPLHNLALKDGSLNGFDTKIQALIRELNPSCIIFSFHYLYIDAHLGHEFDRIPRILTFHSRPDFYFEFHRKAKRKLRPLYRNTTAQILFDSYKDLLPRFIKKGRVITIPNPVPELLQLRELDSEHKKIVFLSRVDRCKGVDLMIRAFAIAACKHPGWALDIWGEWESDELKAEYEELALKLGVKDTINFAGVTTEPVDTLCNYDFCIFPSLFEGFSIGLAESLSVGLPCIGLKKCSGVNEMIENGVNGFLCEASPEDMAGKISLLMQDDRLRKEMSAQALKINGRYEAGKIKWLWSNCVRNAINQTEHRELFPTRYLVKTIKGR